MPVIHVNFSQRKIVSEPLNYRIDFQTGQSATATAAAKTQENYQPREPKEFSLETDESFLSLGEDVKQRLRNRFGDEQPRGGVSFKAPETAKGWIDTYGRGNFHNSKHQFKAADSGFWNRPQPFPSEVYNMIKILKRSNHLNVGLKSDPFMWLDHKYQITKGLLIAATRHGVTLTLHTMSDLCAHSDYISLLKGHNVVINMGCGDEREERFDSPGAPSIKRRMNAFEALKAAGVNVTTVTGQDHMKLVESTLNPIQKGQTL